MTSFIWLLLYLSCPSIMGQSEDGHDTCFDQCGDYHRWGLDCAMREQCFQKQQTDQNEFVVCYTGCMVSYRTCNDICLEHYEEIAESCSGTCEDASIMDVNCEKNCFKEEFNEQFSDQLPELTPNKVDIWQGVPFLGEDAEEEPDDSDLFGDIENENEIDDEVLDSK